MPDLFVPPAPSTPLPSPVVEKPRSSMRQAFSSFVLNPQGITVESQDADEEILLLLRRHFITNLPWILISILLIVLPPLFGITPFSSFITSQSFYTPAFGIVVLMFYYACIALYVLISFTTWFYNVSFVTRKRLIDVDFSNLIYHDVAITKYETVEDVRYQQTGFFASLFNYGDVIVQTAGEKDNFEAYSVPRPQDAVRIIGAAIGQGEANP